jgi:hypothetical protein
VVPLQEADERGEDDMKAVMKDMYQEFLTPDSPQEVNLSSRAKRDVLKAIGSLAPKGKAPPICDLKLFERAMKEVEQQLRQNLYAPFLEQLEKDGKMPNTGPDGNSHPSCALYVLTCPIRGWTLNQTS